MKDIAKEANVSAATVSYILNNVKNQKISDETRERVMNACKRMGYLPNLAARTLATKKSGLIGILNVKDFSVRNPWQDFTYSNFLNSVEITLSQNGFHILYANVDIKKPELNVILQRELDGVLLLNMDDDMFYKVSKVFSVPVLIVDGYLEDPLFHKIVLDYESAFEKAKQLLGVKPDFVIADKSNNRGVIDKITDCAGVCAENLYFSSSQRGLAEFAMRHKGQKGIVLNEFVGLLAARYLDSADFVTVCTCDCPSILPETMKKVAFKEEKNQIAADLTLSYVKGDYSECNDKYTIVHV